MNKGIKIDAIFSWEIGIIIILLGLALIFFGVKQSKKDFDDLDKIPLTKPTTKIIFGSTFLLVGFIQLLPLIKG